MQGKGHRDDKGIDVTVKSRRYTIDNKHHWGIHKEGRGKDDHILGLGGEWSSRSTHLGQTTNTTGKGTVVPNKVLSCLQGSSRFQEGRCTRSVLRTENGDPSDTVSYKWTPWRVDVVISCTTVSRLPHRTKFST